MRQFLAMLALAMLPATAAAESPAFLARLTQAEGGSTKAMVAVGEAYLAGDDVARDCYEARRWLKRAAEQGAVAALFTLGRLDDDGICGLAEPETAFVYYKTAAEQGHVGAQYRLGQLYQTGRGVDRDDSQALRWYTAAARKNDPLAWCGLAELYGKGYGVAKNRQEARKWLQKGLRSGNADAKARCGEVQAGLE